MTSEPSTPTGNNDDDDIFAAMDASSSPLRPGPTTAQKRSRDATDNGSDAENGSGDETTPVSGNVAGDSPDNPQPHVNQNATAFAKRLASRKKLRKEQEADVEAFVSDTPGNRQTKLYIQLLAIENQLATVRSGNSATFQVSKDLEESQRLCCGCAPFHIRVSAYKGNVPKDHLLAIVKKYDFGLPPDIEKRPADWAKVVAAAQYALTQTWSSFKKSVGESIQEDKNYGIYTLAKKLTANTRCSVTSKLCARVALLRRVYVKSSGKDYWNAIDEKLEAIRTRAEYDSAKITKAFKMTLETDHRTYGVDDGTEMEDNVEDWQQGVDDSIEAAQRIMRPAGGASRSN